jgi:hypothetical protein
MRQRRFHSRKGPACSVCVHKNRALIEQGRVAGISLDNLSKKFGPGRDAIFRHMRAHVSDDVKAQYILEAPLKDLAATAAEEGVSLIEYFAIIRAALMQQFQLAVSCNDKNGTAILAGRLTEVLNAMGRLTGEVLNASSITNITTNNVAFLQSHPAFARVQAVLLQALAKHPQARADVVAALRSLDAETSPPAAAAGPAKVLELEAAHVS